MCASGIFVKRRIYHVTEGRLSPGEVSTKVNVIFPWLYSPRAPAFLLRSFKVVVCILFVVVLSEELLYILYKPASSLLYLVWKHFSRAVCTSFSSLFVLFSLTRTEFALSHVPFAKKKKKNTNPFEKYF